MYTILCLFLLTTVTAANDGMPSDAAVAAVTAEINDDKNTPPHAPVPAIPRLTIDTDSPLDMTWTGALTLHGVTTTPPDAQIVIPWIHGTTRTINNLDVRVRVLDVWF